MFSSSEYQNLKKGLDSKVYSIFHTLIDSAVASEEVVTNTLLGLEEGSLRERIEREPYEVRLKIPRPLNRNLFLQLAILSWYLPPITAFELQESLREWTRTNLSLYTLKIYLESEELMLLALLAETHVTIRTLFGNILTGRYQVRERDPKEGTRKVLQYHIRLSLSIQFNRPPAPKVRRRGYNDHHSSAPTDKKIRENEFAKEATAIQRTLELKRTKASLDFLSLKVKLEGILHDLGTG